MGGVKVLGAAKQWGRMSLSSLTLSLLKAGSFHLSLLVSVFRATAFGTGEATGGLGEGRRGGRRGWEVKQWSSLWSFFLPDPSPLH